ncbi:MAG TPA: VOC family protein [Anaerolineales bacterium]|jgi:catechol 2,3-dioxygenase-like lactoylglutathione lyase family enzyme
MHNSNHRIKGLGEVSIRVSDLAVMQKFYEEVLGLEVLRREKDFVFFKIAAGYGDHPQVIALFTAAEMGFLRNKSPELDPEKTTLHHIALNISLEDFETERRRLEDLRLNVQVTEHAWLHVRSLYFADPEGNLLEFVCSDASVL